MEKHAGVGFTRLSCPTLCGGEERRRHADRRSLWGVDHRCQRWRWRRRDTYVDSNWLARHLPGGILFPSDWRWWIRGSWRLDVPAACTASLALAAASHTTHFKTDGVKLGSKKMRRACSQRRSCTGQPSIYSEGKASSLIPSARFELATLVRFPSVRIVIKETVSVSLLR